MWKRNNSGNNFQCKACGKPLCFIKTPAGRMMPCDTAYHHAKTGGTDTLVNRNGEVVKCTIDDTLADSETEGFGWVPHWGTCKNADKMRKSAKPPVKKRPASKKKPQTNGQMNMFEMMR